MISYYYDNLNELVREDNKYLNQTITYTYDGAGNITSKNIYAYTTGEITGEPKQSYSYSYNDTEWKDLLTNYNGEEITYDAIGNPTSYLGNTLTWQGHQLSSVEKGNTKATYTYDANGLRTTKTVNGTKTYYQYSGDKLIYQETGNKRLYFWYDAFGSLCEVLYDDNGTASAYMVVCNSRGDVERLYDVSGNLVARYIYDSWGNVISVVDASNKQITNQNAIGNVNPIRYRGYYLDSETGYYYLQSRYYNPQIGRFLNADLILNTNMFSYCGNNPIMCVDSNGCDFTWTTLFDIISACIVIDSLFPAFRIPASISSSYSPKIGTSHSVSTGNFSFNSPSISTGLVIAGALSQSDSPMIGPADVIAGIFFVAYILISALNTTTTGVNADSNFSLPEHNQAYFPTNPLDFHPLGLTTVIYVMPGTGKNGGIIKWEFLYGGIAIFEWDEDCLCGAHYHTFFSTDHNKHNGSHYLPGQPVPEPWNTFYF